MAEEWDAASWPTDFELFNLQCSEWNQLEWEWNEIETGFLKINFIRCNLAVETHIFSFHSWKRDYEKRECAVWKRLSTAHPQCSEFSWRSSMVGPHNKLQKSFFLSSWLGADIPCMASNRQDILCRLLLSPVGRLSKEFWAQLAAVWFSLENPASWRKRWLCKFGHCPNFIKACIETCFKFLQVQKPLVGADCRILLGWSVLYAWWRHSTRTVALYNVDKKRNIELWTLSTPALLKHLDHHPDSHCEFGTTPVKLIPY